MAVTEIPINKSPARVQPSIPSRQLDQGVYCVYNIQASGERTHVGRVFVEGTERLRTEHYVLTSDYESPSGTTRLEMEKCDELGIVSRPAFFRAMQDGMDKKPLIYIKSVCEYSSELPEL